MVSNGVLDKVKGWLHREPRTAVSRTILIVDGNASDRRATAESVVQLGYEALEAPSVADAIEQLEAHDPDCVLLSFDVPDAEGLDGLQRIRDLDAGLDVIMLARDWHDSRTAEAMRRGAVAYLAKPFSQNDLRELLARH
ncbi:MAG TPA: response regulator [Chloroflexota bacterium]|jgi:DNA-binding NtrC family response regulator|nr:response regulator [Chloroflexota bacterium]